MASSTLTTIFVLCMFFHSSSSTCNLPSRFWCESKEIASACDVTRQCEESIWNVQPNASPVKITLYYESLCPDCRDFFTNMLYPTYLKIGSIMNLDLVPYGNAKEKKVRTNVWQFTCQHGPEECEGNIIETCAISVVQNISVYLPFIHCIESSEQRISNATEMCGAKYPEVPLQKVLFCALSQMGNELEHQMALKTSALRPKHTYVPWVTINGVHTKKIEDEAETNLLKLICDTYQGPKPSECC